MRGKGEKGVSSLNPIKGFCRAAARQQNSVSWPNGHGKGEGHAADDLFTEKQGKLSLLLLGGGVHDSADLGDLVPPALSIAHAWGQDNGASFL